MSWKRVLIILLLFLLTGCNALSGASPTRIVVITAAIQPVRTSTVTPILTPTPSPTPTATQTPTSTPDFEATAIKVTETQVVLLWRQMEEKVLRVCEGNALPEAAEYNPSMSELNPSLLCVKENKYCTEPSWKFDFLINQDISKLDVEDITELHLVICLKRETEIIQNCLYTGGSLAERVRFIDHYSVISPRTGKIITTFALTSSMPPECPQTIMLGSSSSTQIHGDSPGDDEIFKKLNRYFHLPTE
jgi:hypothetical protein